MKLKEKYKKINLAKIAAIIFLGTTIFFFLEFRRLLSAINLKNNEYPFIDPARHFTKQEDFIVNIQPLREKVRSIAQEFGGSNVSIYVEFLNTGANISINPDTYIFPASLAKLPISIAAMKKVQDGDWGMDSKLVLMKNDIDANSGIEGNLLADKPVGTRFTIEELIKASLRDSDNTANDIILRNLAKEDQNKITSGIGLEQLFTKEGRISAKEYSRILRSLYTASYLNRENSQTILKWLSESDFKIFLVKGIPEGVTVSHKYGENIAQGVYSDSGIVYIPNRPYIISVMYQGDPNGDPLEEEKIASDFISQVSRESYNYFANYKNQNHED